MDCTGLEGSGPLRTMHEEERIKQEKRRGPEGNVQVAPASDLTCPLEGYLPTDGSFDLPSVLRLPQSSRQAHIAQPDGKSGILGRNIYLPASACLLYGYDPQIKRDHAAELREITYAARQCT